MKMQTSCQNKSDIFQCVKFFWSHLFKKKIACQANFTGHKGLRGAVFLIVRKHVMSTTVTFEITVYSQLHQKLKSYALQFTQYMLIKCSGSSWRQPDKATEVYQVRVTQDNKISAGSRFKREISDPFFSPPAR